jgi:hypothetical protein
MKNITIPATILIIMVSSCTKSVNNPVVPPVPTADSYINFDKKELEYVLLPLSMHYIYQDSATGNVDSVEVTHSDLTVSYAEAVPYFRPALHFQEYNLVLTKTGDSAIVWFQGSANSYDGSSTPFTSDSTAKIRFVAKDNIITIGGTDYGFSPDTSSYLSYQYQSSLEVKSKIYNDVIVCTFVGSDSESTIFKNFKSTYYWAKNVGIIKRTIETNSGITTSLLVSNGY